MFRCSLQCRFLTKCSGSVVVSAPARTRIEALMSSLGWPWAPGGPLGDPLEALESLEELRSDFGVLRGFWAQSCQSRNDDKTLLFIVFWLILVFR